MGRSLRVVYLDHCAKLSGGELAMLRLVDGLPDIDRAVVLAEDGPLVPQLRAAGVTVDVLPIGASAGDLRRTSVRPSGLPLRIVTQWTAYTIRLARHLRRSAPDLVHTNSLKAALYGTVAARLAGVPVVCHIRDRISEDYLPGPAVHVTRLVVGLLSDAVIANSATTLATLGLNPDDGGAILRCVIHDALPATAPGKVSDADHLRVGMVGRISPWKGQDVFLRAFALAFPDGAERARIVGAPLFGEDDFDAEIRSLVHGLDIDDRVVFTGFRHDVAAELRDMDVLVHASVIPEPFGQVVVEGMAAGLAVVASDAGGPAEVIEDGVDGFLYPPGDVSALAAALQRLATDAELRRRIGRSAATRALDFRPEVIAPMVGDLYRRVLERQRPSVGRRLGVLARRHLKTAAQGRWKWRQEATAQSRNGRRAAPGR